MTTTMLNMDFAERVLADTRELEWLPSPKAGVWRKPLARQFTEHGHATSIVKYDPGAQFSEHDHPLGEEIYVLEGTFSDHTGDYQQGQYFRNPEGFKHAPFSKEGCTIFVKLHQFQTDDTEHVNIDTNALPWRPGYGELKVKPLFQHKAESCALVFWPAGAKFIAHQHWGGEEIYVLQGEFIDEFGRYPAGTWLRNPHGSQHSPYVEVDTLIWVKVGHL